MSRIISGCGLLWVVVCLGLMGGGCDKQGQTDVPGDEHPGARVEGAASGGQAGQTAHTDGQASKQQLPTVRDRDPEEEKKKLALSKRRSAEARKFLVRGALTQAVDHARQALRIHEQNVDAMLVIAEAFYKQGKYELTQAVASSALAVDPKIRTPQDTSRAHNLMGFALVALGNPVGATNAFRKAAETDEKNAAAWNNLGTRYLDAGDVDTALSCFKYALDLEPRFAKAHLNYGAALRAKKKWVDAERAIKKALSLRRNYAEAYFNLGVLYLDADPYPGLDTVKRLNRAIQYLTKYRELAIADGPDGPGPARPSIPGPGPRGGGLKGGPASVGPPVSRARADDYIRVAKKGIEREQRRLEREKQRKAKGGTDEPPAKKGAEKSSAAKQSGDTESPPPKKSGPQSPSKPAPSKPTTQQPGASKKQPDPSPPKQPVPKKPSGKPEQKPSKPPAEKPTSKQPTQKEPTQKPAPQKPAPQKPKVQRPGGHAVWVPTRRAGTNPAPRAHRPAGKLSKNPMAWNPRRRFDTNQGGPVPWHASLGPVTAAA